MLIVRMCIWDTFLIVGGNDWVIFPVIFFLIYFSPPTLDLSFQAATRIMSTPVYDALKVMKDIAQNFPIRARYDT